MLRQLRDAMAGHGSAQDRLDRITQIIARGMVAEVCSVYVLRPGDILELFATEGLRKDAVHRTRLRIGEVWSAISPPMPGRSHYPTLRHIRNSLTDLRPAKKFSTHCLAYLSCEGDGSSVFWSCRTKQSGGMPKKRLRHWRPLPWFWRNWSLAGSLCGRRN